MADAFDIIIRGGRVMDPETGFDQTCDVAIKDGTIARIVGGCRQDAGL